jgi:polysaccharide biosynthesis/export protein
MQIMSSSAGRHLTARVIGRMLLQIASLIVCFNSAMFSAWPTALQEQAKPDASEQKASVEVSVQPSASYILGPGDQINIHALDIQEIGDKPFRIEESGNVDLPLVGKVHAAGLTLDQLKAEVTERLKAYIQEPDIVINVTEFQSQPVTVVGAVTTPGVFQLHGRKTLLEMISMAGGLRTDAGYKGKITRLQASGPIPLPSASPDATGKFSIAEVNLKAILEAINPQENILVQPHDVISIPRADIIYVMGEVHKSGGFALDRDNISVVQAVALAEGLGPSPSAGARILRATSGSGPRTEVPVDLKKIMAGKANDVILQPNDILVIPHSTSKAVLNQVMQGAIQGALYAAIYGWAYH